MAYLKEVLSKNLRLLRGSKSQSEIAIAIGVSQSTYSRWEKGLQWVEDPENLERLAAYYSVPSSRFFFDPDIEKPLHDSWANRPSPKEIAQKLEEIADLLKK